MKRGFFIPADIWEDQGLTLQEKVIMAEIVSFTKNGKDCYISNARVAEILGLQERRAKNVFYGLVARGVVRVTRFDGKHRFVEAVEGWQQTARQTGTIMPAREARKCPVDRQQTARQTGTIMPHTISTDTTYPPILESTDKNLQKGKNVKRFVKPTYDELKAYANEIGFFPFDPNDFLDYYDSKGWVVGKSPMKDWHAALRTWKRKRDEERLRQATPTTHSRPKIL